MQTNKALLIGSGYFGQILRPYITKHCEILAIANTATSNLSALMKQADICFIITPLNAHFELAKAALQAGCHTFVEKPATKNAREYRELLSIAWANNRVLFTDYIYTLSPSIRHALSLCKHKSLESICANFTQYGKFYKNESVLEVLGVHYLSVFALMQELGIIKNVRVQECVFLDSRLSARLGLSARQGEKDISITLECSLLSPNRQRVLRLFFSKEHYLQVDMLDSTPLSYKAYKQSSLPIFDESENLSHSLATFMSFIASHNLAQNVHYVIHTKVCETTACLLDSAFEQSRGDFLAKRFKELELLDSSAQAKSASEATHTNTQNLDSSAQEKLKTKNTKIHYDCIIIGGGFFGAYAATTLSQKYRKILIVEKECDLLLRASINNQARVHNGYHYPRSLSTALSSARHFTRFCDEFAPAIDRSFEKYYAIAAYGSKTSATQFYRLFKQFSIPIERAGDAVLGLFAREFIEDVFCVQEYAFNANILREILQNRLRTHGVEIALNTQALRIFSNQGEVGVSVLESSAQRQHILYAPLVLNCTYAGINTLLHHSALPLLPLKYELTEIALVQVPQALAHLGVTIMDGQFFSLMPYPAKGCYTLSHVRYTPHCAWSERAKMCDPYTLLKSKKLESKFPFMRQDAARYLPELSKLEYIDSLYEIKTLRTQNEIDDGRPIIFAKDYGVRGFCTIMDGKIDNIYEIIRALQAHF